MNVSTEMTGIEREGKKTEAKAVLPIVKVLGNQT
jgi:hypothetical protein